MKLKLTILIVAAFIITMGSNTMAEDMNHDMGHQMSMEKMDHGMHQMDGGVNIHNSVVDGYRFSYQLIDIREKMAAMKAEGQMHEGMDATNHLMVFIKNPEGASVENAKVGYLVEGPKGSTQKHMCIGMGGGYGSDLKLADSGDYTIKTKAVVNGKSLVDDFTYTVK